MQIKASTVKFIQIRCRDGNQSWSKEWKTPEPAARYWAKYKTGLWLDKKFDATNMGAAYHRMTNADWDNATRREEKLYRRSLRIFRLMLK